MERRTDLTERGGATASPLRFLDEDKPMNTEHTKWTELLDAAVKQPGMLMKAYSAFHNYVRHAI